MQRSDGLLCSRVTVVIQSRPLPAVGAPASDLEGEERHKEVWRPSGQSGELSILLPLS